MNDIYLYWTTYPPVNAIFRHVTYLSNNARNNGLISLGLGDWCAPDSDPGDYIAPLELTDITISMGICEKSYQISDVLGMELQKLLPDSLMMQPKPQ